MQIIAIIAIICIIKIITIFRIILCFQGWNEGTIEGLGSSVGYSRGREQEQHTSIPGWLWASRWKLNYRCPAAESWRGPCNDYHGTFFMETDCSKPAFVLGVPQHQTIEKCKMALALGRAPVHHTGAERILLI